LLASTLSLFSLSLSLSLSFSPSLLPFLPSLAVLPYFGFGEIALWLEFNQITNKIKISTTLKLGQSTESKKKISSPPISNAEE